MLIYYVGKLAEYQKYQQVVRFPATTVIVSRHKDTVGRTGPAIIFLGAESYALREYVAIRDQLKANHPDAVLIRLL